MGDGHHIGLRIVHAHRRRQTHTAVEETEGREGKITAHCGRNQQQNHKKAVASSRPTPPSPPKCTTEWCEVQMSSFGAGNISRGAKSSSRRSSARTRTHRWSHVSWHHMCSLAHPWLCFPEFFVSYARTSCRTSAKTNTPNGRRREGSRDFRVRAMERDT